MKLEKTRNLDIILDTNACNKNSRVMSYRQQFNNILHFKDDRIVVIVGPCSIHNDKLAYDYANLLIKYHDKFIDDCLIIMRTYLEKPRTCTGWKGILKDPDLNESYDFNKGITLSQNILSIISNIGMPCATEFVDLFLSHYIQRFITWGAIGARTVESAMHRDIASNLKLPIGFKNNTSGSIKSALDAVKASSLPCKLLTINKQNKININYTIGNKNTHIVLRGSNNSTNFSVEDVNNTIKLLKNNNLPAKVLIDCSHGNCMKNYKNQIKVSNIISDQIINNPNILGLMIESNINEGNQDLNNKPLKYGISITDNCLSWKDTENILLRLSYAVQLRRIKNKKYIFKINKS